MKKPCRKDEVVKNNTRAVTKVVNELSQRISVIHWKFDFPQFFSTEEKNGKLSLEKLSPVFHATVEWKVHEACIPYGLSITDQV